MFCKLFKYLANSKGSGNSIKENINPIKKSIQEFSYKRIWVTKKVRILAEERMNDKNSHSIILINFYTFFILCYSILGLKYSTSDIIIIMSVIVSVGLFGVSLFVSLYGYREKALAFKMSHIELSKIETKMNTLLLDESKSDEELLSLFEEYQHEYTEVLSKTDNHVHTDYLKYRVVHGKATTSERFYYRFLFKYPYIIFMALLYLIPVIGLVIILKDVLG